MKGTGFDLKTLLGAMAMAAAYPQLCAAAYIPKPEAMELPLPDGGPLPLPNVGYIPVPLGGFIPMASKESIPLTLSGTQVPPSIDAEGRTLEGRTPKSPAMGDAKSAREQASQIKGCLGDCIMPITAWIAPYCDFGITIGNCLCSKHEPYVKNAIEMCCDYVTKDNEGMAREAERIFAEACRRDSNAPPFAGCSGD